MGMPVCVFGDAGPHPLMGLDGCHLAFLRVDAREVVERQPATGACNIIYFVFVRRN